MDIAWVIRGGGDPVKMIKKNAANITSVHIKDIAANGKNAVEDGWAILVMASSIGSRLWRN